jgi:hypothetical protein
MKKWGYKTMPLHYYVTATTVITKKDVTHRLHLNPADMEADQWCLAAWAILKSPSMQVRRGSSLKSKKIQKEKYFKCMFWMF